MIIFFDFLRKETGMEKKDDAIRKQDSLSSRTIKVTVTSCVMLGLISLIIGLGLYGKAIADQYINRAVEIADYAAVSSVRGADAVSLAEEVMEIYNGLDEKQRQQAGSDEYRAYFSKIDQSKGSDYDVLYHMLEGYLSNSSVNDVYLAMYDEENNALVYFADPERKDQFMPGDWEPVDNREIRKFLNWDGDGKLYDISKTIRYGWMCTAGSPIRNSKGEIVAFAMTDVGINSVIRGMTDYVIRITLALAVFTGLISWILTMHMKNRIVEPINKITHAAETYIDDKNEGVIRTDHFSQLDIRTGDELENLSNVMADMEEDLAEHVRELMKVTAEKERIGTELEMGAKIQASMLPHEFPPFPDRDEFELYATMHPAREVGGDFYDFFFIDDDHLCLVAADVSGKGIPGALFMMISKVILQSCAMLGLKTAEILNKTNEALCSNNQVEMFVTVWLGILELSTGRLTAANAGHEYPFIKQGDRYEMLKDKHGLVIGGMPETRYTEYTIQMNPGDSFFIYTDGIPEANDPDKRFFGLERLEAALNVDPEADCEKLIANVKQAVDDFVKDADQFDDQCMLAFRYKG